MEAIVTQLIETSTKLDTAGNDGGVVSKNVWTTIVLGLLKEVVSTVDPDVRNGDSLDIRPYVKIKVIPGTVIFLYMLSELLESFVCACFVTVVLHTSYI